MTSPSRNTTSSTARLLGLVGVGVTTVGAGFAIVLGLDAMASTADEGATPAPTVAADEMVAPDTAPTPSPTPVETEFACDEPDGTLPSPLEDLEGWLDALPQATDVGTEGTAEPLETYGMRASEPVMGMTIRGGRSAALLTLEGVEVGCSLLGGAADGLKPADGTVLRDSVVSVSYGEGAHADHVQVTDRDGVEIRRVRLIAENERGTTDIGWNAAFFVHGDSTDWVLEDVHVQAGVPDLAIRSYFPLRLTTGRGIVRRVVVDRDAMRTEQPLQVEPDAEILVWEDVFIREPNGSLTAVPRP